MANNDQFHRFRALSFLKEAIGLEWNNSDVKYFCFISSISSSMVFAISPLPCGEHYVEPISRNLISS